MTFKVGDEVNLSCRIKLTSTRSFAAAKWIRQDSKEILKTTNFSNVGNSKVVVFVFPHVINHVSTDDAGYYTCVVNFDGYGSQNESYKLRVKGKWFLSRFFSLSLCAIFQSSVAILCCNSTCIILLNCMRVWLPYSMQLPVTLVLYHLSQHYILYFLSLNNSSF